MAAMLGEHLLMALMAVVSSALFLGLAVLGWGGFGAFLAHPPFIALLAQAPPISIARSVSLRRSVFRKGSTPCS